MTPHHRAQGISLLEVIMVIALISLLAAQSAPAFYAWLERSALTATTHQTVALLRQAQQLALANQTSVSVSIAPGKPWCLALSDQPRCDCFSAESCRLSGIAYRFAPASSLLTLTSNRAQAAFSILFDGLNGSSFTSAGTLTLAATSASARIIISPLGRVRACSVGGSLTGLARC